MYTYSFRKNQNMQKMNKYIRMLLKKLIIKLQVICKSTIIFALIGSLLFSPQNREKFNVSILVVSVAFSCQVTSCLDRSGDTHKKSE